MTSELGIDNKEQLIYALIEAHEGLIDAASAAHERGISCKGEQWGPREIMAHVAGWEAHAMALIPRIQAGVPPMRYVSDVQHTAVDNAVNAAVIAVLGDQSFDSVRDILRQAYQRDVQMLESLDDGVFVPDNYVYKRVKAAIDHVHEHARELNQRDDGI